VGQKFGQHFLSSPGILDRIACLICSRAQLNIIEIGPGRGALTERLLGCAAHVTAIEIDRELVTHLRSRFAAAVNLDLVNADALTIDFAAYQPDVVAGNLPYYVATPLIERTVQSQLPGVFLIQKEVAQRLSAQPGSRDYGFLSVQTQLFATPELIFTVPPGAFKPPPKVDSAVVRLTPNDRRRELGIADSDQFIRFLSVCFKQKRKTLRNNLRGEFAIDAQPEARLRAEQLSLDQFAELWRRLAAPSPS
jgi:16S rRNA (adenine1518-N6/adenine1519-N6)-dimethyltransferase